MSSTPEPAPRTPGPEPAAHAPAEEQARRQGVLPIASADELAFVLGELGGPGTGTAGAADQVP